MPSLSSAFPETFAVRKCPVFPGGRTATAACSAFPSQKKGAQQRRAHFSDPQLKNPAVSIIPMKNARHEGADLGMNPREIFETQGRQPETQLAHTHYNLELIAWHFLQPLIELPTENVQGSCRWSFLLWHHKVFISLRGAEQIAFRCAFRPFPEWGTFECTAYGSITVLVLKCLTSPVS